MEARIYESEDRIFTKRVELSNAICKTPNFLTKVKKGLGDKMKNPFVFNPCEFVPSSSSSIADCLSKKIMKYDFDHDKCIAEAASEEKIVEGIVSTRIKVKVRRRKRNSNLVATDDALAKFGEVNFDSDHSECCSVPYIDAFSWIFRTVELQLFGKML